jgi:hypothetical protein
MPFGDFLDAFPGALFYAAHLSFLVIGLWAIRQLSRSGVVYASALGLYATAQAVFLMSLAGVLTLRMSVFIEQSLIVVMVVWITVRATAPRSEVVR